MLEALKSELTTVLAAVKKKSKIPALNEAVERCVKHVKEKETAAGSRRTACLPSLYPCRLSECMLPAGRYEKERLLAHGRQSAHESPAPAADVGCQRPQNDGPGSRQAQDRFGRRRDLAVPAGLPAHLQQGDCGQTRHRLHQEGKRSV